MSLCHWYDRLLETNQGISPNLPRMLATPSNTCRAKNVGWNILKNLPPLIIIKLDGSGRIYANRNRMLAGTYKEPSTSPIRRPCLPLKPNQHQPNQMGQNRSFYQGKTVQSIMALKLRGLVGLHQGIEILSSYHIHSEGVSLKTWSIFWKASTFRYWPSTFFLPTHRSSQEHHRNFIINTTSNTINT